MNLGPSNWTLNSFLRNSKKFFSSLIFSFRLSTLSDPGSLGVGVGYSGQRDLWMALSFLGRARTHQSSAQCLDLPISCKLSHAYTVGRDRMGGKLNRNEDAFILCFNPWPECKPQPISKLHRERKSRETMLAELGSGLTQTDMILSLSLLKYHSLRATPPGQASWAILEVR